MAEYILKEEPYPLKALVAFGMNHRMWPKPSYLQEALKKLEFYVNVDLFLSDSSDMADIVLPAATFFEREEIRTMRGGMVGLSEAAVCPCGEAKMTLRSFKNWHAEWDFLNRCFLEPMRNI